MNINELGAAALVGDVAGGDVCRVGGDIFVQIKDLVITDEGASFTTMGGHRIPVTFGPAGALSRLLAGGGMLVIPLPGTLSKVTLSSS